MLEKEAAEAADDVVILGDETDDETQVEDTAPNKAEGKEPEAGTETAEEPELSEVEKLALDMGWSPKDKWRGAPEMWRPATEFIKRGYEISKEKTEQLRQKDEAHERNLRQISKTADKALKRAIENEKNRLERELQDKLRYAASAADPDASVRAYKEHTEALKGLAEAAEAEAETDTQAREEPQAVTEFKLRNREWFGPDSVKTAAAKALCAEIEQQFPNLPIDRVLQQVETEIGKRFGNAQEQAQSQQQRPKQPGVEGGLRPIKGADKKSFAALPEDVRKVAHRMISSGYYGEIKSDAERKAAEARYAKDYFEDEE